MLILLLISGNANFPAQRLGLSLELCCCYYYYESVSLPCIAEFSLHTQPLLVLQARAPVLDVSPASHEHLNTDSSRANSKGHPQRFNITMCRKATCSTCQKTTWWGCGLHVPMVFESVPEAEWCVCAPKVEKEGKEYPPKGSAAN